MPRPARHHLPMPDESRPNVPTYYANYVARFGGLFDLALTFGYTPDGNDPEFRCRVILSWEEARLLREYLSNEIAVYEDQIGSIRNVGGEQPIFPPEIEGGSNGHNVTDDDETTAEEDDD